MLVSDVTEPCWTEQNFGWETEQYILRGAVLASLPTCKHVFFLGASIVLTYDFFFINQISCLFLFFSEWGGLVFYVLTITRLAHGHGLHHHKLLVELEDDILSGSTLCKTNPIIYISTINSLASCKHCH